MAENKMEQLDFWIRYFKEHTNTIGCVELDGLDCREVLALLQELADKKVDNPNKMEAVAQLFGKKLGEDFVIQDNFHYRAMAKFNEEGLLIYHDLARGWLNNPHWLFELVTGQAVIVDD